jgi:hypothetical protein
MKKKIEKEITICDVCQIQECDPEDDQCLLCGKVYCYECAKTHCVYYSHSVYGGGIGDGLYCLECDRLAYETGDKLHSLYRKIRNMKTEREDFLKDFRKRSDKAESELNRKLTERKAND